MGRVRVGMGVLVGGLAACQPLDGEIFSVMTSGPSTTTDDSADAESSVGIEFACVVDDVSVVNGDDPRFDHECGEDCDSDWCGCESCRAVGGPIGRLAQGAHRVRIIGGASGTIDYHLTLRLDTGEVLTDLDVTHDGLFEQEVDIEVPVDCPVVEIEWIQLTSLCSRFYEVVIEPG